MFTPRHRARQVALQILYRYDILAPATGASAPQQSATSDVWGDRSVTQELEQHFEHFQVPQNLRPFAAQLVIGTLRERKNLDQHIERILKNWKISRIDAIDRCLLRMATYEMAHCPETPRSVVINEAIELAKQFGTTDSPAFVNGVLDAIRLEPTSTVGKNSSQESQEKQES